MKIQKEAYCKVKTVNYLGLSSLTHYIPAPHVNTNSQLELQDFHDTNGKYSTGRLKKERGEVTRRELETREPDKHVTHYHATWLAAIR